MSRKSSQKNLARKATDVQSVKIQKKTTIHAFTPEEELNHLIERGDWELVLTCRAFQKRSQESQAQAIREAIDNRIYQLGQSLNYLVNRGPEHRAAAMGVLQRKQQLERIRDDILKQIYEQFPAALSSNSGKKIDFY